MFWPTLLLDAGRFRWLWIAKGLSILAVPHVGQYVCIGMSNAGNRHEMGGFVADHGRPARPLSYVTYRNQLGSICCMFTMV